MAVTDSGLPSVTSNGTSQLLALPSSFNSVCATTVRSEWPVQDSALDHLFVLAGDFANLLVADPGLLQNLAQAPETRTTWGIPQKRASSTLPARFTARRWNPPEPPKAASTR